MSEEQNIPEKNSKEQIPNSKPEEANEKNSPLSLEGSPAPEQLQPETINDKPETETMEVHKHPHHVIHKKKWGEYLLEFSMIFLAVFLGFLAENWREDIVEHMREKQFMTSLVKDLELDTVQLVNIRGFRLDRLNRIDSIFSFFATHSSNSVPLSQYQLIRQIYGHIAFYQNSGTLDQLKNASGLRLIRKRTIVDSIEAYDQQIKKMILRDGYESDRMIYNSQIVNKMFDGRRLLKIHADTTFYHKRPPPLETTTAINPIYVGEYLNQLYTYRLIVQNNLELQATIRRKGKFLIELIKKGYHLE